MQGVRGEDLAAKDAAEVSGGDVGGSGKGRLGKGIGFEFERGDAAVGYAAGNDPGEVTEVGGDVEREAVGGDALCNMDADGGDLLFLHGAAGVGPDAGAFADALGGHAEVLAGEDEGLLQEADEVDGTEMRAAFAGEIAAEVEDGITDELAGAVIGDVTAAVDLVDLDAFAGEQIVGGEDVGASGVAAEGQDGRVLHQEERVADGPGFASFDDLAHVAQTFRIGEAAELDQMEDLHVNLMELNLRTADCSGLATLRIKVTGPVGEEGCVELACVERITQGHVQLLVLSDEKGE